MICSWDINTSVDYFVREVNPRFVKTQRKSFGGLAKLKLTSIVKIDRPPSAAIFAPHASDQWLNHLMRSTLRHTELRTCLGKWVLLMPWHRHEPKHQLPLYWPSLPEIPKDSHNNVRHGNGIDIPHHNLVEHFETLITQMKSIMTYTLTPQNAI